MMFGDSVEIDVNECATCAEALPLNSCMNYNEIWIPARALPNRQEAINRNKNVPTVQHILEQPQVADRFSVYSDEEQCSIRPSFSYCDTLKENPTLTEDFKEKCAEEMINKVLNAMKMPGPEDDSGVRDLGPMTDYCIDTHPKRAENCKVPENQIKSERSETVACDPDCLEENIYSNFKTLKFSDELELELDFTSPFSLIQSLKKQPDLLKGMKGCSFRFKSMDDSKIIKLGPNSNFLVETLPEVPENLINTEECHAEPDSSSVSITDSLNEINIPEEEQNKCLFDVDIKESYEQLHCKAVACDTDCLEENKHDNAETFNKSLIQAKESSVENQDTVFDELQNKVSQENLKFMTDVNESEQKSLCEDEALNAFSQKIEEYAIAYRKPVHEKQVTKTKMSKKRKEKKGKKRHNY